MIERIPVLLAAAGIAALAVAALIKPTRAAEAESRSSPTHILLVCQPGGADCKPRGRPMGETACLLDMASEALARELPTGTWLACRPVRR